MKPGAGQVMLAVCGIGLWGAVAMVQAVEPVAPRVALIATTLNADSEKYLDVAAADALAKRGGAKVWMPGVTSMRPRPPWIRF